MVFEESTVMIVDDIVENIKVAMGHLQALHVKVVYATNGLQALERAEKTRPNLILMDVMMPQMGGFETAKALKKNPLLREIPIIFLTARAEAEDVKQGFEAGGVDYITKPFNGEELLMRVKTHLELTLHRCRLEEQVSRRTQEIELLKSSIIEAMGSLAEYRDGETGAHIKRTQHYVKILCQHLLTLPKYAEFVTQDYAQLLFKSAPLHDIGKVGIRDHILLKPGKLTPEEFEIMKQHAAFGEAIIDKLIGINGPTDFLVSAREITGGHHEKWNGSGYPRGLSGEEIPLSARIMAIADVYDALTSPRVYKIAFSHQVAIDTIRDQSGKHFDPTLVEAFLHLEQEFLFIATTLKD
ncbi:response regulator [Sulfurospirillum sp. T05]|uniref:Response regulator n=1 Tax=Sulfurospirillum tamanense TaxID=2813362 RepID=A0ABS2WTW2_9BACT|nr:HD domain-containing phosphohydrolase [Sulfurospirillum tamanensis]MBN2965087.1 response regulator [Sulfurospirillum tamanensis]